MAKPCTCRSPHQNPSPTGKDEPAGAALTESSSTPTSTLAVSQALTPAPVVTPAVIPNPDNKLFKQFMKAYLEAQTPAQIAAEMDAKPRERLLKAWLSDFYYRDLHIECYLFCQQYENHFDTARAKGSNQIPFAASFLRKKVFGQWLQYKRRNNGAKPMTWPEFKDFLQTNLGDSKAFVDGIWSKIKHNSQYQNKLVQDWGAHLEFLQSILTEFDAELVPVKVTMICIFWKGL